MICCALSIVPKPESVRGYDKSPAESADKSAHSKVVAASPLQVHWCPFAVETEFSGFERFPRGAFSTHPRPITQL